MLTEIRLLGSTDFDSRAILSVVLTGDNRLLANLRSADLQPVASRVRQRLVMALTVSIRQPEALPGIWRDLRPERFTAELPGVSSEAPDCGSRGHGPSRGLGKV